MTASIIPVAFYSPVFPWLAETPIIVLLIIGKKSGYFWAAVSIIMMLAFGIMRYNGYIFPRSMILQGKHFFSFMQYRPGAYYLPYRYRV